METQPKKRGRKPKKKLEEIDQPNPEPIEISTDLIPVKKKRGRKPKPKTEEVEVKIPKKRGRKPKEIFKPTEPTNTVVSEEAVILHLNIKNNNSSILNIEDEFIKYNPTINIPAPFMPDDLDNAFYLKSQSNKNFKVDTENIESDSVDDKPSGQQPPNVEKSGNLMMNINNSVENVENDAQAKNNKDIYEKYQKKNLEYSENYVSDKNRCMPIFIEFMDANKKQEWPKRTNIDCLWCCHSFENEPFGIPIKKIGDKYQMFGNFCSAECAASYIFDMSFLNDCEKAESYSLLNLIYNEIEMNGIQFAPPKLCLKRFGGRVSIEQYRSNLRSQNKSYNVIIPPLTSIIPNIEETNISKNLSNLSSSILNDSIVSRTGELLRLKRVKPLPDSNNTLEACMNLKLL
jgi:hypothetical protein